MNKFPSLEICIPGWLERLLSMHPRALGTIEERMRLAVLIAAESILHGGGPFGALVVEEESGAIIAPGANLVTILNSSIAHAEIVAIAVAERISGSYDLSEVSRKQLQLVTSAEPCAMCLGAIPWSGIRSVVCGARGEDAEIIGFDEGAKPADWPEALERRGIRVIRDICREEAAQVLSDYAERGGVIYNAGIRN